MVLVLAGSVVAWGSDPSAIAASAAWHVEHRPRLQRNDCSGLVESILARGGVPVRGNTASLWASAQADGRTHRQRPTPGDLVFWDRTYDRDHNGRLDDMLSHIGVVIRVEPDDTVVIAHRGSSTGISEVRMNLSRPKVSRDADGSLLNSWLRSPSARPEGPRLAGELFHGYASVVAKRVVAPVAVLRTRALVPNAPPDVLERAIEGRRLRELDDLDCDALWVLRNAVYARHGFRFTTVRAITTFEAMPWYTVDPVVDAWTVGAFLTRRDEANVAGIRDAERAARCR